MVFTLNYDIANWQFVKLKVLMNAKSSILRYKILPHEAELNDYVKSKHGWNLVQTCLYLIANCKIYNDGDNKITVLFKTKELDNLAAIITYGNGIIQGSNILKKAFRRP